MHMETPGSLTVHDQLTCSNQHGLSSLRGVLVHVAGERGVVLREIRGGQVLQHYIAVFDGICLNHHRILAHLSAQMPSHQWLIPPYHRAQHQSQLFDLGMMVHRNLF